MWPHEQRKQFSLDNTQHLGLFNGENSGHQHRSTTMDIVPGLSNPRASRNLAEKQRRDNLNSNISAMASLLPMVAGNSRKTDKISILRLAGAYLRYTYTLGQGTVGFIPPKFNSMNLEQFIINTMCESGGFFIVVSTSGKIVYVSQHVEQQLGHAQNQLLGESLYNYVCPEDHEELTKNLTVSDSQPSIGYVNDSTDENSSSSEDSSFKEQRRSFNIRISQRTVSRREHIKYECFHVSGSLCLAKACRNNGSNVNRLRQRENSTNNDIIFVGIARLLKRRTLTELSLLEADKDEYITRHLVDGRIIFCDHRISVVAGYMAQEVSGKSAFAFMHKDDWKWTMIGLRQMYSKGEEFGHSCYRLVTKNKKLIYLRTHGYLEFDKKTQTVISFVCVNTLMSTEEGEELVNEMKRRFSATTSTTENFENPALTFENEDFSNKLQPNATVPVEDPSRLEDAITDLISDLPSSNLAEEQLTPSPLPNTQFFKAAMISQRLPPALEQANKMGIKNIEHVPRGKGIETNSCQTNTTPTKKSIYPDKKIPELDRSPNSIPENSPASPIAEKVLPIAEEIQISPCHSKVNDVQNTETRCPSLSRGKDLSLIEALNNRSNSYVRTSVVQELKPFKVKVERVCENHPKCEVLLNGDQCSSRPENLDINLKKSLSENMESNLLSDNRISEIEESCSPMDDFNAELCTGASSSFQMNLKRRISEEEEPNFSCKKLLKESYPSHDATSINSTRLEMSGVSLQDTNSEYPPLHPTTVFVIPTSDELLDLQDLQDLPRDILSSPVLEQNSDTFDETRVERFAVNDEALSEEITRRQLMLADGIEMCESQFSAIERNLEKAALQPQRDRLIQLQADHKVQKQLLKTLQKEHHNIQSIRW